MRVQSFLDAHYVFRLGYFVVRDGLVSVQHIDFSAAFKKFRYISLPPPSAALLVLLSFIMIENKISVERLLCCNVLTSDEFSQPSVFRHPFYKYEGPIVWPPPQWELGKCLYCAQSFDRAGEDGERIPAPPVPLPCFHGKRTG